MRVTLAVTAWMLSVVSSSSFPANTLPDIENEDFIKDCVRMHNKFRSEVTPKASDMLYMTWDPVLAQIAKAWARNCQFAHNIQLKLPHKLHPNFTSLGENLWTGSLHLFSVSSAVTDWYNEIQYYDFKTQKCDKVCGHYTQYAGLSLLWPLQLRSTGSGRAGSAAMAHGPSRSAAYGILPDRGTNPRPLHRLFGQIVIKLAVQYSFVLEFLALKVFAMEHILYATMDQQAITQPGHIKKDPHAVPAPVTTTVWTISALTHNETK
ncbi:glioma pathogenesis-related protein 1 isoform X2 [Mesoplodon densirostris]|uniref:glioma pathogenesis-related protein 1 isoform X2 n=1 Tax=Mesoplodon densirostris TaxID=48708 RepID=UPI0028DB42BF|nr:glioma pathogenesis-related protein 1 isoform X2 [Mesoplodon densirostris]